MRSFLRLTLILAAPILPFAACSGDTESGDPVDAGTDGLALDATADTGKADATASQDSGAIDAGGFDVTVTDAIGDTNVVSDADAGVVLPPGFIDPIAYTSFNDSPFKNVSFPSYFHFEDWEDGLYNTPGVTADSTSLGTAFGVSLVDSIDGDDGAIDGVCAKDGGSCNSAFSSGTITFTFDATDAGVLAGGLPTHVGIAWTDGSTGCDAIFEAYGADGTLLGTRTATGVGDNSNHGTVTEDRFFGIVHTAGVKKIVVKSSSGGIEVDHLQYGR